MTRALLVLALALPLPAAYLAGNRAGGSGTVTDSGGQPLPGVTVTATRPDGVVLHSVVTGSDGAFEFASLPAGTYALRVRRIGYEDVTLNSWDPAGPPASLTMHAADVFQQMPSSEFLALLPEGEEKRAFILDCAGCHQFDQQQVAPAGTLRSRASWVQRIQQMLAMAGGSTGFPIISPSRNAESTADWLVQNLGDETDPLPVFTAPAPMTGSDAAFSVVEYDIPVASDLPHDLMPDADGNVIITGMFTSQMYVLDPAAGTYTTVPTPANGARALDIDDAGRWWVVLGSANLLGVYDGVNWTTYPMGMYPHDVVLDDAGRAWFNGHFTVNPELIGFVDVSTGQSRTFEVPVGPMPDGGSTIPYGLRVDAQGTVWMTQLRGNRLVRFDPVAEAFTLYDMPTTVSGPRRPAVAPDGAIWIPAFAANKLARFDPATETFDEWTLPIADALPYIARVDPADGTVWLATAGADAVLRFHPDDETWNVYRLPSRKALVRHMEPDPAGGMWLAYGNSPSIDPKVALIRALDGSTETETGSSRDPLRLRVYPNPSDGTSRVAFDLPRAGHVRVEVLDAQGRRVAMLASSERTAGGHVVGFDASALDAGTYVVRLSSDGITSSRGMVVGLR